MAFIVGEGILTRMTELGDQPIENERYLPLKSGNLWTYSECVGASGRTYRYVRGPNAVVTFTPDGGVPATAHKKFSVWNGVSIASIFQNLQTIQQTIANIAPEAGVELEWIVKAGEGGTWQSSWDSHPLALSGPTKLISLVQQGRDVGLAVIPYINLRGRTTWLPGEYAMIEACASIAPRVILNLEPGTSFWNGPTGPLSVSNYLAGINRPQGSVLELTAIPRQGDANQLGGDDTMRAWLAGVDRASWECYDTLDANLAPNLAIPLIEKWLPTGAGPGYRIPIVQKSRIGSWAGTSWAAFGLAVWRIDGD